MDFLEGIKRRMQERGTKISDLINEPRHMRSKVYGWFTKGRKGNINVNDAVDLAYFFGDPVEVIVDEEKGENWLLRWAEAKGIERKPPPKLNNLEEELFNITGRMKQADLKKLVEIARICVKEELESTPQTKIG
jgi:hypothetical protein